jgi:hypothetical protein
MLLILTFVKPRVRFVWKEILDATDSIFGHLYHHYILGCVQWEDPAVERFSFRVFSYMLLLG